jgi:hypothetical protein
MTGRRAAHLHLLVLVALAMVLAFDVLGWPWLPVAFPASGILMAAGGAASAGLYDRLGSATAFYRAGLLRVLLPVWIVGAVLVPVLLSHGWHADDNAGSVHISGGNAWLWLLPLSDPPVSTEGLPAAAGVWFVRAWLWFVLLTPALLWSFRRWPVRVLVLPAAGLLLVTTGLATLEGRPYDVVTGLCGYAVCWLIGFGYADGALTRLPWSATVAGGGVLIVGGLGAAAALKGLYGSDVVTDIPLAAMLVSTGGALLLLRLQPLTGRLGRLRRTTAVGARVLAVVDRRVVTGVLWAGIAAAIAPAVRDRLGWSSSGGGPLADLGTAAGVLVVALLLVGWVEALAAAGHRPWFLRWSGAPAVQPRRYVFAGNVVDPWPSTGADRQSFAADLPAGAHRSAASTGSITVHRLS